MNNKGQQLMVGIMILVMAVIIFIALIPAIKSIIDVSRQSDSLNCEGYVHPTDGTKSYNSSLEEDSLSCTIIALGIPYLILGVLVGLVAKLLHGRLTEPAPPPVYGGYGGAAGYPGY